MVRCLVISAGFFLIVRTGYSIKVFDLLMIAIGMLLLADSEARRSFMTVWPHFKSYLKYFVALIAFILLGEVLSGDRVSSEAIVNYGRVIFNTGIFFLAAFLMHYDEEILENLSLSVFLSPLAILPAYWTQDEGVYVSGGRLKGLFQNPIILGLWMTTIFVVGTGLFMTLKKSSEKLFVILWISIIASFSLWAGSRAGWLGGAVALLLCGIVYAGKKKWPEVRKLILISVGAVAVGYLLLPNQQLKIKHFVRERAADFTVNLATFQPSMIQSQAHSHSWPKILDFVVRNPFGYGLGYTRGIVPSETIGVPITSSSFFEVVLSGGWAALAALLMIFSKLGIQIFRAASKDISASPLFGLTLAWMAAAVLVVIDISFTDAFLWRHVWFVLGAALGVSLQSEERSHS